MTIGILSAQLGMPSEARSVRAALPETADSTHSVSRPIGGQKGFGGPVEVTCRILHTSRYVITVRPSSHSERLANMNLVSQPNCRSDTARATCDCLIPSRCSLYMRALNSQTPRADQRLPK